MNLRRPLDPNRPQIYLDKALRRGRAAAEQTKKKMRGALHVKLRKIERERIRAIRDCLVNDLNKIGNTYLSLDKESEFQVKLLETAIDFEALKTNAKSLIKAADNIDKITIDYLGKYGVIHQDQFPATTKAFIGRISGIVKKISSSLEYIKKIAKLLRNIPIIREDVFTVAIAGFPNVGKSTVLAKITTAKPEINEYPFTTKGLNVGWQQVKFQDVQIIDTPGTLAREKENLIEQRATLVLKYLANAIVFIIEPLGEYPLDDQQKLLTNIKNLNKAPLAIYISKKDIANKDQIAKAEALTKKDNYLASLDDVKEFIKKQFKQKIQGSS